MRLHVSNIGMIGQAEIELNGLTVIAGENDVGKSTIGKLFFSIIQAMNKYKAEFEKDRLEYIKDHIERLYAGLRRIIDFEENNELQREFRPSSFYHEIIEYENSFKDELLAGKINLIENSLIDGEKKEEFIETILEIKNILNLRVDDIDVIKRALGKALSSEFNGQINSLTSQNVGVIKVSEGENLLFNLTLKNNSISELLYLDDIYLKDVTYIESPLIFQIHDIISGKAFDLRRKKEPAHILDLITKLQLVNEYTYDRFSIEELVEAKKETNTLDSRINELIQGNIRYQTKSKDFVFSKKVSKQKILEIFSDNIATGIKSFGILQMLLNTGVLDDRSLLIIDEPEVHLHPKWQIEYGRIIVDMARLKIPILINTHSPYILQSIRYYSQESKCTDLVKYYLAEVKAGEMNSTFDDVTDCLSKAFKKLSDPLQRLVWSE